MAASTTPAQVTEIQSVVGTTSVGKQLNLSEIATEIDIKNHDKGSFNGAVFTPPDNNSSVLVFPTGRVTVTGGKSRDAAREAVDVFTDRLKSTGIDVSDTQPVTFKNVVCTAEIDAHINLNAVAIELGLESVEYDPEHFTGLIYRPTHETENVTIILFHNGSVLVTGAKRQEQADKAVHNLAESLTHTSVSDGTATPTTPN